MLLSNKIEKYQNFIIAEIWGFCIIDLNIKVIGLIWQVNERKKSLLSLLLSSLSLL